MLYKRLNLNGEEKKYKLKIGVGFGTEIVFFILAGMFLFVGQWGYFFISLLLAMLFAGYTGKLIGIHWKINRTRCYREV